MVPNEKRSAWFLPAVCCNLLWGSAVPFINLGYSRFGIADTGSQLLFAGCRFLLAGLMTVLFRSLSGRRAALPEGRSGWRAAGILALIQTVAQYIFFYVGVANTASVKASIILGLNAFVSILIAAYVFRYERMTARKWVGGVLGVLGVAAVSLGGGGLDGGMTLRGEGFLILSMTSGAASAGLIKRFGKGHDPVALSGWQFMLGGCVLMALGAGMGGRLAPRGAGAWAVLGYLALLSAVAYGVWAVLLKKNPVSRVAVFMFLQPLFGVVLSLILIDQPLERPWYQYAAGLLLVCVSIYTVNRGGGERP